MNDRGRRNSGGVHGGGQDPRGYGKNDAPYGNGEIPYREVHTNRKKKRKRTFGDVLRFLLMIIALGVFLYSGWTLYGFYQDYKKGSDEYDNLESSYAADGQGTGDYDALDDDDTLKDASAVQSITGKTMKTIEENGKEITVPVMRNPIDFDQLKAVNEDIVGWLRIRALDISYPLVQGEDNDYYLHRTFERTDNFAGCLFMNCDNEADFTDQNTIIYGHNMKNGSMFGKLKNYNDPEVFNNTASTGIYTPDLIYQYRIFSAAVVNKVGLTYQVTFTEDEFNQFVNQAFANSVVDNTDVEVTREDRVVTLSTCTGDDSTRFVVMGRLAQVYASKTDETKTRTETGTVQ